MRSESIQIVDTNISWKSISLTYKNSLATSLALKCSMASSVVYLMVNIYLEVIIFVRSGFLTL
jgi:hypothetical protein